MKLLYQATNISADMDALNNEDPNPPNAPIDGVFGVESLATHAVFSANVVPRTSNVMGYQFELAFFMETGVLIAPQLMWYYSSADLEVVALPGGAGTPEAQRLGGRWFQITVPAGAVWGYVRLSDFTGAGNPAVDLMIWRADP